MTDKQKEAIGKTNAFITIMKSDFRTGLYYKEYLEAIETVLNLLEKKDKIIDEMAKEIKMTKPSPCTMTNEYSTARVYMSKEEIKQYFERKIENGN